MSTPEGGGGTDQPASLGNRQARLEWSDFWSGRRLHRSHCAPNFAHQKLSSVQADATTRL